MRSARVSPLLVAVCLIAGMVSLFAQTRASHARHLFHRHRGRAVDAVRRSDRASRCWWTPATPGERDLGRIVETLKAAGVRQIDHMWSTHYHGDHIGSLLALAKQVPIARFYDHGAPHPNDRIVSAAFLAVVRGSQPGEADDRQAGRQGPDDRPRHHHGRVGEPATSASNLRGGGQPNPACAEARPKDESSLHRYRQRRVGGVRDGLRPLPHRSISAISRGTGNST